MSSVAAPVDRDDLVDREVVLRFLLSAAFWLVFAPTIGVILSIKFNYYDFLGNISWLTWGRLRPVHVMGVIFGAFSSAIVGLTYYMVPRLCGVRMYKENWSRALVWIWNIGLTGALVSLPLGQNIGIEAGEFPLWANVIVEIALIMITIQVVVTVVRRKEPRIYVTLWYLTAAYIWTVFNYAFGHFILPYSMPGVNNAAMHGLYIHYVVGLWITPAGLAVIYYFLPLSAQAPALQPQTVARRFLVAGLLLSLRRNPPLHLQSDPVLDADDRHRGVDDADHSGLDGPPEFLRHVRRELEALPGVLHRQVPDHRGALLPDRLFPGVDGGASGHAAADAFHGFRDRALAPDGLRDLHPVGDGRHVLRDSEGVRPRALFEDARSVALLAHRGRLLADGVGSDASGTPAGDDARRRRGLRGLDGGDEALLVHADARRRHDGHRCAARNVELLHDGRAWATHRGAGLGAAAAPEPQWT